MGLLHFVKAKMFNTIHLSLNIFQHYVVYERNIGVFINCKYLKIFCNMTKVVNKLSILHNNNGVWL